MCATEVTQKGPSYHGDHTYNLLYLRREVQAASQRCITCTHCLCRVIPC